MTNFRDNLSYRHWNINNYKLVLEIAVSNSVYLLTSILLTLTSTLTHFSLYENSMVISSEDLVLISPLSRKRLRIEEVVSWISEQSMVADFSEASAQKNRRIRFDWHEARKPTKTHCSDCWKCRGCWRDVPESGNCSWISSYCSSNC